MALSKVLRDYITKKYDDKKKEMQKSRDEAVSEASTMYYKVQGEKGKELCSALYPQIEAIKNTIKEAGFGTGCLSNISGAGSIYSIKNYPNTLKFEVMKPFNDDILKLDNERDRLLIKLSLEKDFDRINAILKEHNIDL